MHSPDIRSRYIRLFVPLSPDRVEKLRQPNSRFVHYTSADAAFKILTSGEVWMRNARNMNDLSEVEHGKICLLRAYHNPEIGGRLQGFLDDIYPGFSQRLIGRFSKWAPQFEDDTYLTCLSEHYPHEDTFGRLSMWRAYAPKDGVALVVKSAPFQADNRRLGAYSSPVF